ncbi:MAG: ATP-dependent RNA helicase HrpA [Castellaniella sp.]
MQDTEFSSRRRPRHTPEAVPLRPLPTIEYPEDLPVSRHRDAIARAIEAHPVVIVCGETGSGKTTQLPKICLALGRGRRRMIGHTQPRRLAASSVANRIASELGTELGDWVGYQVRFHERSSRGTAIKLMTDGILLAESQRDPMLRRYDTIIIDEAHERSLNIDFLLGFLRQLLERRRDLKLIITSATLDAGHFARHFSMNGKPAPVIEVSGRLHPVELRYRPVQSDRDEAERDLTDAVVDAVAECHRHGPGDVLVFLPGEREIRECAEALEDDPGCRADILPLFARLSRAEQERIFSTGSGRARVVLATNVAETSLTVPGIRYVVDSGLARVKRYSWRNKVEQLCLEPVSQASARQRAGRCGRIGPGVCIRLYSEDDHDARDAFTDPEILRSSLASVILRMKSLGLQDVEAFPFVDPPPGRAIADGYHTLQELGALDDARKLTAVGRDLARLPVDPRVARMILAAREQDCLTELLVIAAALSVQDPRERPLERREAATQAHARFRDPRSEFLAWLKLWQWCESLAQEGKSRRQQTSTLRAAFISPVRLREWREVHAQLLALVREQGWRVGQSEATYEQIHCALLSGLLSNIGLRGEQKDGAYQGARDLRFYIHPGSDLVKKAGAWIMAAELVQTSRLFARCVARIEPAWIERVGRHLLRRSWSDPRWEKRAGQVVAGEQGTLYGLTIYSGRRVHYARIDPDAAREIFIRDGLVGDAIAARLPFLEHNRRVIAQVERLEHQARRPDILVDDALIAAFYKDIIPANVMQTASLERWYARLDEAGRRRLLLTREDLMRHDAGGVTTDVFPRRVAWQGVEMALDYHFEPGSLRDGVTLSVPLLALGQIDARRCEWLVPGMLKEKVRLLLRSLPQRMRRHCVPLPEYARGFHERWFDRACDPDIGLLEALSQDIADTLGVRVTPEDFRPETLPAHLFMNFRVIDEHGRMLSGGRNLEQLRAEHREQAQSLLQEAAQSQTVSTLDVEGQALTGWTFGTLPEILEIRRKGQSFIGYPALIDVGLHCEITVFDDREEARQAHRRGLLRLFQIALRQTLRGLERQLPGLRETGLLFVGLGSQEDLRDQILLKAVEQACLADPWPRDAAQFEARCREGRTRLVLLARELVRLVQQILQEWMVVQKKLPQIRAHTAGLRDMREQLERLMTPTFIRDVAWEQLRHYPRYLKAIALRIDRLRSDAARDARWQAEVQAWQTRYERALAARKGITDPALEAFGWMLQELRVALFAQELRTPMPMSPKRVQRAWEALQR